MTDINTHFMPIRSFNIVFLLLLFICGLSAQRTITLDDVIKESVANASPIEQAKNEKLIADTRIELYQSNLRPSLGMEALLPNFINTSSQVTQPDGSIAFQQVTQNNSSISLQAIQNIASTGGRIFAQSDLQRFDDFSLDFNSYNGVPIRVGIVQPLFAYNPFKWDKKILPLQQKEADANYQIEIENTKWRTTSLYFDVLIAQANVEIAKKNKTVNEELIKITEERYTLGKTSKDEVLQLKIQYKNAILATNQAQNNVSESKSFLATFIGVDKSDDVIFSVPEIEIKQLPSIELMLQAANNNRPELIRFQRELMENDKQIALTKSEYGIQAQLYAGVGFARASQNIDEVYTSPQDEQQVSLSISVPLIDWGKKKEATKINELLRENTISRNQQNERELITNVTTSAKRFLQAQDDIILLEEIRTAATQRYEISNQRYTLGNISLTDLTLAQREKDQTMRDYILALRSYWTSYYKLRTLTGMEL